MLTVRILNGASYERDGGLPVCCSDTLKPHWEGDYQWQREQSQVLFAISYEKRWNIEKDDDDDDDDDDYDDDDESEEEGKND